MVSISESMTRSQVLCGKRKEGSISTVVVRADDHKIQCDNVRYVLAQSFGPVTFVWAKGISCIARMMVEYGVLSRNR